MISFSIFHLCILSGTKLCKEGPLDLLQVTPFTRLVRPNDKLRSEEGGTMTAEDLSDQPFHPIPFDGLPPPP
jgi:hypothetical protein